MPGRRGKREQPDDSFAKEEELKKRTDVNMDNFKDRVRYPVTMYVDDMEFQPRVPLLVVTRTAYDLLLTEADIYKLHEWLSERIKLKHYVDARIRFIGRTEEDG
jgi:hypothetical protein